MARCVRKVQPGVRQRKGFSAFEAGVCDGGGWLGCVSKLGFGGGGVGLLSALLWFLCW